MNKTYQIQQDSDESDERKENSVLVRIDYGAAKQKSLPTYKPMLSNGLNYETWHNFITYI